VDLILTVFPFFASVSIVIGLGVALWANLRYPFEPASWAGQGLEFVHNRRRRARAFLAYDIKRAGKTLQIVNAIGCDWLYEGRPARLLRKRHEKENVKVVFLVGPDFDRRKDETTTIRKLEAEGIAEIKHLKYKPIVDLRLIDGRHVHLAYHGLENDKNKTRECWRSRSGGAPADDLSEAEKFWKERLAEVI
jgi:hypothetical protein